MTHTNFSQYAISHEKYDNRRQQLELIYQENIQGLDE